MRRAARGTTALAVLVTAMVAVLGGVGAGSAQALSCAPPPTPEQIVSGQPREPGGTEPYVKPGGYAVVARVAAIEPWTGPTPRGHAHGGPLQAIRLEPLATFFRTAREPVTVINRGVGMWGYGFEVGSVYFVPVPPKPEAQPVGQCGAIEYIEPVAVQGTIATLLSTARVHGVPAAQVRLKSSLPASPPATSPAGPVAGSALSPAPGSDSAKDTNRAPVVVAAGGAVALLLAGGALLAARRRRPADHSGRVSQG